MTEDWQAVAYRLFGQYMRGEERRIRDQLNWLSEELESAGGLEPGQVDCVRQQLLLFEESLTVELGQLDAIDRESRSEQLARLGRELHRTFVNLALYLNVCGTLPDEKLEDAETQLEQALAALGSE